MFRRAFRRALLGLAAVALTLVFGTGCKKEEADSNPNGNSSQDAKGAGAGGARMPSPGEVLFGQKGCVRCHAIGGAAAAGLPWPKGKRTGPELTKVGADPAHTPEWFRTYIRNPHGQNPASKMPAHDESKISEQEMETLVNYLGNLK